ncbi:MAG: hypothetical protein R6X02_12465 [Enhygromyxa sp.]
MRSLANLLEAAVRRSATEVVLESGQPVVFTTARGSEAEQSVLPRTELFDMIVAALDDASQVELAVGNPVDFTLEAGASWTIAAEPGIEGMTVRATREAELPSLELELDDEPGFALEDQSFAVGDLEPDFGDPIGAPPSPSRSPRPAPPAQLDVEALDAPTLDDPQDFGQVSSSAPAAPFESGTWELADDDELDIDLDGPDEGRLPTGFPELPPSGYESQSGHIGVPDDDDDDDRSPFDPFAEPLVSKPLAPTRPPPAMAARSAARARPAAPDMPTRRDISAASPPEADTQRELGALGSPEADTQRELPALVRSGDDLAQLAASIDEGTLVYVHEPGLAESLARSFAAPSVTIDDQIGADEIWAHIRGLPSGTIVIVRREDPSSILGWILRRLEEGFRVFVESRARTAEGARRILLGVGASDRAERWLDSQVALVIEPGEGGPRVRQAS